MRARSCGTIAPAPRLRWPTSELPIWPSGSPTASPFAVSVVCGCSAHSRSNTGVSASATALPGPSGARPQPSSTTRQTAGTVIRGRGLDDRAEVGRVEARAADERAVDVGQRQQLGRVVGLARAAVEDPHLLGRGLVEARRRARARTRPPPAPARASRSGRCRSPRSARRRRRPRAAARRAPSRAPPGPGGAACARSRRARAPPRSRRRTGSASSPASSAFGTFSCSALSVSLKYCAALGVAEHDAVDVDLGQHRGRDLAGERARVGLVHGLRVDRRPASRAPSRRAPAARGTAGR